MKTEQEIRERIAEYQQLIEEEEDNGKAGGDDWMYAVVEQRAMLWVLGERAPITTSRERLRTS
jgi:hypothetical protein